MSDIERAEKFQELPVEVIRNLLSCNFETGELFWLPRPLEMFKTSRDWKIWNTRYAGKPAFTTISDGYKNSWILGKRFKAHRVIWVLATGKWPTQHMDHIDLNRQNNALKNLREATLSENMRNRTQANNTSGFKGVGFIKRANKWSAKITVDGTRIWLGNFKTPKEASAAYNAAATKYHGEFARTK